MKPWLKVVFSAECDEDGNCPICDIDFADCACPGPTQDDEFEYDIQNGVLMARSLSPELGEDEWADLGVLLARPDLKDDE